MWKYELNVNQRCLKKKDKQKLTEGDANINVTLYCNF